VALREPLKSLKNAHMRPEQSINPGLELPFCDPILPNKSFLTNTIFRASSVTCQEKMMNIVRFEPWSIADLVQRDLDRIQARRGVRAGPETPVSDWVPAVDIVEENDRFLLRADVPGVDRSDIDVSMEDGVLTIAGERHTEKHEDAEGVRRYERVSGRFHRRFALPETADAEGITARSANGILEVSIAKQPVVQPRRITVEAA
jgi:HSP20 family protein